MRSGLLVRFSPDKNYRKTEQLSSDGRSFKLYETISGHRNFGKFHLIPVDEIGLVINTIEYESIAAERARVLFPSGIGWVDARDVDEVACSSDVYL